ncbi:hypothetical protein P7T05_06965 [Pantoea anthophila]|uniref:hypothetical protein n=1 Tax=Pantoea anthophila TaxID=470931 RepID=UPI0025512134|nr:hypothetical protein [Pantoea anthophila]WIM56284.1 hypothetical protein P7T05_06965 [Pantoea anthophila]
MSEDSSVKRALCKVINFYKKLDTRQRLYFNLILFSVLFIIGCIFFNAEQRRIFLIVTILYWTSTIMFETVSIYKKIYNYTLGKALLLIGFTLCTNVSLSIAGIIINDVTTVAPSNFPHALILVSIAIIPFIMAIIMLVIYFALFITFPMWGVFIFIYDNKLKEILFPGYKPQDGVFLYKTTKLVQILSIGCYCVFFHSLFNSILDDYTKFLYSKSQSFIYTFEMYGKSPCVGLPSGKVAFINDDNVLIAHKQGEDMSFITHTCEYKK